jgi:hypothetical protein
MSIISVRLTDKDDALIRKYAEVHNMDLSTFIRQAVMEKIEDEYDLDLFNRIWEESKSDERFAHDVVKKELGL